MLDLILERKKDSSDELFSPAISSSDEENNKSLLPIDKAKQYLEGQTTTLATSKMFETKNKNNVSISIMKESIMRENYS